MKLIDLLVKELPKLGGWPDGVNEIGQDYDGELMFYGRGNARTRIYLPLSSDHRDIYCHNGDKVTKDRYELALSASKKPTWNGEGLPPVGCECEAKYRESDSAEWFLFRCVGVDCGVAFGWAGKEAATLGKGSYEFRPIRSEADKKRDAAVEAINYWLPECIPDTPNEFYHAKKIYDAIAAGKIPGVKLDD